MKRCVYRLELAEQDLREHFEYLLEENPRIALQFIGSAESAFERLVDMPLIGAIRKFDKSGLEDIRMWPIPDFERFLIFYRPRINGIEIVRVLYGLRDIPSIMEDKMN